MTVEHSNMLSTKLWGEMATTSDTESGMAVLERDQITKRPSTQVDGPRLFQPSETLIPISKLPSRSFTYNPTIIHTIKLLKYVNKVRNLVNQVQLQEMNGHTSDLPSTPLIPSHEDVENIPDCNEENDFLNSEIFRNRIKKWPEEMSNSQVVRLSRFDVGVICAHAGFDTTTSSVLDFLSDISRSYTQRICKLLRHAIDSELCSYSGNSGDTLFVSVLERVFHEVGIGSMTALKQFYDNRIIQYHKAVSNNCKALQEEYEKLKNVDNKSQFEDLKMIRIKEESVGDIELPIIKEEDKSVESNEYSVQLEEFQGFVNMEPSFKEAEEENKWVPASTSTKQEPSQQSLVSDLDFDEEIINVSDSPNAIETSKGVKQECTPGTGPEASSPSRYTFQKFPKIRKLK